MPSYGSYIFLFQESATVILHIFKRTLLYINLYRKTCLLHKSTIGSCNARFFSDEKQCWSFTTRKLIWTLAQQKCMDHTSSSNFSFLSWKLSSSPKHIVSISPVDNLQTTLFSCWSFIAVAVPTTFSAPYREINTHMLS